MRFSAESPIRKPAKTSEISKQNSTTKLHNHSSKDKSGVGMLLDYSRDCTVMNGVCYFFSIFFSFNLRNYIFPSAQKCEMTSLHVDLNEAANCVDIMPLTLLAYLSRLRTLVQNTKMATIFGLTYEDSLTNL